MELHAYNFLLKEENVHSFVVTTSVDLCLTLSVQMEWASSSKTIRMAHLRWFTLRVRVTLRMRDYVVIEGVKIKIFSKLFRYLS